jgi:hypothetical protein
MPRQHLFFFSGQRMISRINRVSGSQDGYDEILRVMSYLRQYGEAG